MNKRQTAFVGFITCVGWMLWAMTLAYFFERPWGVAVWDALTGVWAVMTYWVAMQVLQTHARRNK